MRKVVHKVPEFIFLLLHKVSTQHSLPRKDGWKIKRHCGNFFSLWGGRLPGRTCILQDGGPIYALFVPTVFTGFPFRLSSEWMCSREGGSHAEPASQGALLRGEDTVVSGWVASGVAVLICHPVCLSASCQAGAQIIITGRQKETQEGKKK